MSGDYHGHISLTDGSHVALTTEQAEALWDAAMAEKARREKQYPTERECLTELCRIRSRLTDLGWRDAIYCPKDGSIFEAIEFGCTTIFDCWYVGQWPTGSWEMCDGEDLWSARPIAFRLKSQHTQPSENTHG